MSTPLIDGRTAADITTALVGRDGKGLLYLYTIGSPPSWAPWQEFEPITFQPAGASAALIGIFSRWAELLIERLNQVPDKNFVAFLNMLGAAQLPPEPARVPITFALAAGRAAEAIVPQGTQVAAPADDSVPEPSVFELEYPLIVVPATLDSLVTIDPVVDTYAIRSNAEGASAFPAFEGDHLQDHILYLGDDELFGYSAVTGLRLNVNLTEDLTGTDPRTVVWERADETSWLPLQVPLDETFNLTKKAGAGERAKRITFAVPDLVEAAGISNVRTIGSQTSRWLRCRLTTPITNGEPGAAEMVSASQLPTINGLATTPKGLEVEVEVVGSAISPDVGFTNGVPIDLSKEFYPFGERPKRFDVFYLGCREAFSNDANDVLQGEAARITLDVTLANPEARTPPTLAWDYWDGKVWQSLTGMSDDTNGLTVNGAITFDLPQVAALATVNGTESYFIRARIAEGDYGKDATLAPDLGSPPGFIYVPSTLNPPVIRKVSIGYEFTKRRPPKLCVTCNNFELTEVSRTSEFQPFSPPKDQTEASLFLGFSVPAGVTRFPNTTLSLYASVAGAVYGETIVPLSPLVSIAVAAREADTDSPPEGDRLVAHHHFTITNASTDAQSYSVVLRGGRWGTVISGPEMASPPEGPMSITVPAGQTKAIDITVDATPESPAVGEVERAFLQIGDAQHPPTIFTATLLTSSGEVTVKAPSIGWEYWNGHGWAALSLQRDESEGFTKPGLMQFTGPADFASRRLFDQDRYWIRANFDPGDGSVVPRLRRLHLNTMSAIQSATIIDETLGSSSGDEDQSFRTTRAPVLAGQSLQVREIDLPTSAEREVLEAEEGSDAVTVVSDAAGRPLEIWARWHEVPDFYGSGPRDRHYVMDHLTGEVSFGDGKAGWIPPLGTNNVRMASYRTGGGASGNRATGTVTQLKTTVPYVEKPTNPEPADGGAEAETVEAVRERVPRGLRHRDRAVTVEDYEDMAKLASLEVAHARCIALRDLQAEPLGAVPRPGMASVIVVPRSTDAKPLPSLELLGSVETFLEKKIPAGASVVVVGPNYIRVDVTVEVAITADAVVPVVKATIEQRLAAFLHPLTGGLGGAGWDFGREAHKSDLYPLIESVPGVDHTRCLQVSETEELAGIRQTGCFLIYSGHHQVSVLFEEA